MSRGTISASTVVLVVLFALPLSGCGGRTSHPVSATTPYDAQLTCEHIRAERVVNDARIADLKNEEDNDTNNDIAFAVGMGLSGGLFLNNSKAEESEINALKARDVVLDGLLTKKCADAPAPPL